MTDDPRCERSFSVTVLAYPDMDTEDIREELVNLTDDPRLAFHVLRIEVL